MLNQAGITLPKTNLFSSSLPFQHFSHSVMMLLIDFHPLHFTAAVASFTEVCMAKIVRIWYAQPAEPNLLCSTGSTQQAPGWASPGSGARLSEARPRLQGARAAGRSASVQEGPSGPKGLCPRDASPPTPAAPRTTPRPHFRPAAGRRNADGREGGAGSPHSPATASANHGAVRGSLCRGAGPQGYSRALASAAAR